MEYLLHALAACLTSGIATWPPPGASPCTRVSFTVTGDIDLLGILGLLRRIVRNGYERLGR